MKVQNIRSKKIFECSQDFWENSIVSKGNGHLYLVVEDESPIEVKRMRENIQVIKKKNTINK